MKWLPRGVENFGWGQISLYGQTISLGGGAKYRYGGAINITDIGAIGGAKIYFSTSAKY